MVVRAVVVVVVGQGRGGSAVAAREGRSGRNGSSVVVFINSVVLGIGRGVAGWR